MTTFYWAVAIFILLNLVAGLVRVSRGPDATDRMLATLLFGSMGVATLLVLAQAQDEPAYRDVGLLLALVAPVAAVAFSRQIPESSDLQTDRAGGPVPDGAGERTE